MEGRRSRAEGLRVSLALFPGSAFLFLSHYGRCQGLCFSSHGEVSLCERVCPTLHASTSKPHCPAGPAVAPKAAIRGMPGTASERQREGGRTWQKGQDRDLGAGGPPTR